MHQRKECLGEWVSGDRDLGKGYRRLMVEKQGRTMATTCCHFILQENTNRQYRKYTIMICLLLFFEKK